MAGPGCDLSESKGDAACNMSTTRIVSTDTKEIAKVKSNTGTRFLPRVKRFHVATSIGGRVYLNRNVSTTDIPILIPRRRGSTPHTLAKDGMRTIE